MFRKSLIIIIWALVICAITINVNAQKPFTATQTFEGGGGLVFTPDVLDPVLGWETTADVAASGVNSMHASVPLLTGNEKILTSATMDIGPSIYPPNGLSKVQLRFKQICKIAPTDTVRIQYRVPRSATPNWTTIPDSCYQGSATNYKTKGFNTNSYSIWDAEDSLAMPTDLWWQEEIFDISDLVSYEEFEIRFIIKKGNNLGSFVYAGWYLDDIMIVADTNGITPPVVSWEKKIYSGKVYSVGPFEIKLSAVSQTDKGLQPILLLVQEYFEGSIVDRDSLPMVLTDTSNNIWSATIPASFLGHSFIYSATVTDSNGNFVSINNNFEIAQGSAAEVEIGTGTVTSTYNPFYNGYDYAWARSIYLASEIGETGKINEIAFYLNSATTSTAGTVFNNLELYLQAVPDTVIATAIFRDPVASGATLVCTIPTLNPVTTPAGWYVFTLSTPFTLPAGMNLMVYTHSMDGTYNPPVTMNWRYTSTGTSYRSIYAYADGSWAAAMAKTPTRSYNRPNIRIAIGEILSDSNEVVVVKTIPSEGNVDLQGTAQEVKAVICNKGSQNITSLSLPWTVNGVPQTAGSYIGNLPYGYYDTVSFGSYSPKIEGWDTLVVWADLAGDVRHENDTLKTMYYGKTDLTITFVDYPTDTVYSTDPITIKASVVTASGTLVPAVNLNVLTKYKNGTSANNAFPMVLNEDGLWEATIPQTPYGSTIITSISLTDFRGAFVTVTDSFRLLYNPTTDIIVGNGTSATYYYLYYVTYNYSWSRNIYYASELQTGTINSVSYYSTTAATTACNNIEIYFRETTDAGYTNASYPYPDVVADGATLVWTGNHQAYIGWNTFTLQTPFVLNNGQNLEVYFIHKDGAWAGSKNGYWRYTNTSASTGTAPYNNDAYRCTYRYADGYATGAANDILTLTGSRYQAFANAMFTFENLPSDTSAGLVEFVSPVTIGSAVGSSIPVTVRLKNKGVDDIHTCQLTLKINGTTYPAITYTNLAGLPQDMVDTITVGYYSPTAAGITDTITVTLSNPNGILIDPNADDDVLTMLPIGCDGNLLGIKTVGAGITDFPNIASALNAIKICGLDGNLTLELQNGIYPENLNLSNLNDYMRGYTLTIAGASGSTATIQPATGNGITLGGSDSIVIKDITVNMRYGAANTCAIAFVSGCNNITIQNCNILARKTTSNTSHAIYKPASTGIVHNASFINNTIDSGYAGIWFYGGTNSSMLGENIVFDNNTITNSYYYGIYAYYSDINHVSGNIIRACPTSGSTATSWTGIYLRYCNGDILNNVVTQFVTSITSPEGMNLANHNQSASSNALIANNDINVRSSSSSAYAAIRLDAVKADLIHNSLYQGGTGTAGYGVYISASTNNNLLLQNNNIVVPKSSGTPVYMAGSTATGYVFKNNNYYANGGNIGYFSSTYSTSLADWQSYFPDDTASLSVNPKFNNVSVDLSLLHNVGLTCPKVATVANDITGYTRPATTAPGAYEPIPLAGDAGLDAIAGILDGVSMSGTYPISATVTNYGTSTITSISFGYQLNGGVEVTTSAVTVNIPYGQTVTVPSAFSLTGLQVQTNNVVVWVEELNGGALVDNYNDNDTTKVSFYACPTPYAGTFTIGSGEYFTTAQAALNAFVLCGVSGDIVLELKTGNHTAGIDLTNSALVSQNYTLTITSEAHHKDSVILAGTGTAVGITMGNSKNITIKDLTIGATNKNYSAIKITDSIDNVVIRDCNILSNLTATNNTVGGIYKDEATGRVNNLSIVNNEIRGGYGGIYLSAGTSAAYGTGIRIDSNTVYSGYYTGIGIDNAQCDSISHNTIYSRTGTSALATTGYWALAVINVNGNIIGNRCIDTNRAITGSLGLYLDSYHTNFATSKGLIANNEFIINNTRYAAMQLASISAQIVHNSVYTTYTANDFYAQGVLFMNANNDIIFKNNNISVTAPLILCLRFVEDPMPYISQYDMDYNNYYGNVIRITSSMSLSQWQQLSGVESHSFAVKPNYVDITKSSDLTNENSDLLVPVLGNISVDINNIARTTPTSVGAYQMPLADVDAYAYAVVDWEPEVVPNQLQNVKVLVKNVGSQNISNVVFGWIVNKDTMPPYTWTPSSPLAFWASDTVTIGQITIDSAITSLTVYISTVNTVKDSIQSNDTLKTVALERPLAKFVAPLVPNKSNTHVVEVYVDIYSKTGAPTTTPKMIAMATLNGLVTVDTVTMIQAGDIWQATLPPFYFGTVVVFFTTIDDALGNSITLIDTTMIYPQLVDSIVLGRNTGANAGPNLYYDFYHCSWSRNIYRNFEFEQNMTPTVINSISFHVDHNSGATGISNTDSVAFYLQAIDDSTITTNAYVDPIAAGATLVWGTATSTVSTGWNEFVLNAPFTVPVGKNLMVYCNNRDGYYNNNGFTTYWSTTTQSIPTTVYYYADAPFSTIIASTGSTTTARPNMKLSIRSTADPLYSFEDLAIMEVLSPKHEIGELCTPDYLPLSVNIQNFSENTKDFSVTPVNLKLKVTTPISREFTVVLTDTLAPGEICTVVFDTAFPVFTFGEYDFKIWIEQAPPDSIRWNDTLVYLFDAGRIGLPLSETFVSGMPNFLRTEHNTDSTWRVLSQGYAPQTSVNALPGNMMGFMGPVGSYARLVTSQLDLSGCINPVLTFSYYQDNNISTCRDVTMVEYTTDGGATYHPLLVANRYDPYNFGWRQYNVPLPSSFANESCVILAFDAYKVSNTQVGQYISDLHITGDMDVDVAEIFVDNMTACDMDGKSIKVGLNNLTTQPVNFGTTPAVLHVNVSGSMTFDTVININSGILSRGQMDTISVLTSNFVSGTYNVTAYIEPMDANILNDTAYKTFVLNPALSVKTEALTSGSSAVYCLFPNVSTVQNVMLYNIGNLDVENLVVQMEIVGTLSTLETLIDTIYSTLVAGDSLYYTMSKPYTTPSEEFYNIRTTFTALCNSNLKAEETIIECVDLKDVGITLVSPVASSIPDTVGQYLPIIVRVQNDDPINYVNSLTVRATLNDGTNDFMSLIGNISALAPNASQEYTFTNEYPVPDVASYTIKVFVDKVDSHPNNDSASVARTTVRPPVPNDVQPFDKNSISLSQNIPNPASNITKVEYSLPHDGKATFNIYTTAGQVIYSQSVDATVGKNNIIFDLNGLSSGIYFYSMEFEGQKLVRKMSVK
jgi:parallel beta-helix repeat protein